MVSNETLNFSAMGTTQSADKEISLTAIMNKDSAEIDNVVQACVKDGYFYLSVENPSDRSNLGFILDIAEEVIKIGNEFFQLPIDEKLAFEMDDWGDLQNGG